MSDRLDIAAVPDGYPEIERVYGKFDWHDVVNDPGAAVTIDPAWIHGHVATVINAQLPHPLYIHRLCEARFNDGLAGAVDAMAAMGVDYKIESLVSFVPRHKFHRRTEPLSLHSWAIAFDVNPRTNRYGTISRVPPGLAGSPLTSPVWSTYFDVPQEFVEAMKKQGWVWGGDFHGKLDPMHFQLAKGA